MTASTTDDVEVLYGFLRELGYADELLRDRFPVWLGRSIETVDVAGFGRRAPQDMTTATIIGRSLQSRADMAPTFEAAQAIACPAAVFVFPETLELWSVSVAPAAPSRIQAVPRQEAGRLARDFRGDLRPSVLLEAKVSGRQLSLFPVDVRLLSVARRGSSEHLADLVAEAMGYMLSPLPDDEEERRRALGQAARVVVGTLAALMVHDRARDEPEMRGREIFRLAAARFPRYFTWLEELDTIAEGRLDGLLSILASNVNYEGLDPEIVSEVYERSIVSESDRLRLGIFYTPPDLARRIAEQVPFEELPPDDRVVLDPACGSGTFLLAAHDRLQRLAPAAWDPFQRHGYLVSHLIGYDTDQFAVEIAKLSLLLNALPIGNSWRIEQRDSRYAPTPEPRPTVVMSNPPWRGLRSHRGSRREIAQDFLDWMIAKVKPKGFIAVILPAAWLSTVSSRTSRRALQEQADLFEVWRLPEGTFGKSELAPCVVFAQIKEPSRRPWVFRRVETREMLPRFYESGLVEEQFLTTDSAGIRQETLLRGPLDMAADLLRSLPRLRAKATVRSGPVPEPPAASIGGSGDFLYLRGAVHFTAFGEAPLEALVPVRFPEDFHRAGRGDGQIYRKQKVLVPAAHNPRYPWRLKAGIDRRGVIPHSTMHMVIPESEDDLYALLALLGSAVASCWVDTYSTKRDIEAELLRELPIPGPGRHWSELASIGEQLADAAAPEKSVLARRLDQIVAQAYGLPPDVVAEVERHFGGYKAPEGGIRYERQAPQGLPTGVLTRRFGAVLDVEGNRLWLWVPGITEEDGNLFPLPQRFLGWHCVADSTFEVEGVGKDLDRARYYYQARSYQTFDELPRAAGER
jgi:N-6 DNA Methylase